MVPRDVGQLRASVGQADSKRRTIHPLISIGGRPIRSPLCPPFPALPQCTHPMARLLLLAIPQLVLLRKGPNFGRSVLIIMCEISDVTKHVVILCKRKSLHLFRCRRNVIRISRPSTTEKKEINCKIFVFKRHVGFFRDPHVHKHLYDSLP